MAASDALLISVKPAYAERIFAGSKTIELRRTRPRLFKGDLVLIYVSSPVKALAGHCEVHEVIEATPAELWELVRDHAGVSPEEFSRYYSGAPLGFGICLKNVRRLAVPLRLEELRRGWPHFHPPQSYHYLSSSQVVQLVPAYR